jgi:WD40 repeat protein
MSSLKPLAATVFAVAALLVPSAQAVRQGSRCAFAGAAAWSPNGKQIAWAGQRAICVANANGSDAHPLQLRGQRLPDLRRPAPFQLAWPQRNLLVYDDEWQIFVLRPHGVSSMLRDVSGEQFSVDAAGTRIATGCHGGTGGFSPEPLIVIDLANRHETSIGDSTSKYCSPSLSPDGSHVAFKREAESADAGIWTAATDGTHLRQLVETTAADSPLWSPHGDRIAYVDEAATATRTGGAQLRLVSASGGASTLLVNEHVRPDLPATWDTSWSPNGRLFAFVNMNGLLSVVNTATHRVSTPRRPSGQITGIAWSPDGKQRLEARSAGVCHALWRVPVDGGKPLLISRFCTHR